MVGTHSAGPFSQHKIVPIQEAYINALRSSEKDDPHTLQRAVLIDKQLEMLNESVSAVEENARNVKDELDRFYNDALAQLGMEKQEKLSVLLGEELELLRQKKQLHWLSEFLRNSLSPRTLVISERVREDAGYQHAMSLMDGFFFCFGSHAGTCS